VRALGRIDVDVVQPRLDDGPRPRDLVPRHGDPQPGIGRAPAAGADQQVRPPLGHQDVVDALDLDGDVRGPRAVHAARLHVDDVAHVGRRALAHVEY